MISYLNLHNAVEFYEKCGFKRIESPWTVTEAISKITKPEGVEEYTIKEKNKVLVASGEQSFLYLYNKGFLPKGKFQTVTPCFRDEIFDEVHTKYFMKNELIDTESTFDLHTMTHGLERMIESAKKFFGIVLNTTDLKVVSTGTLSYDIWYKNIELGSYGIRSCSFLTWIYGTGCAEPRLSFCQNLKD